MEFVNDTDLPAALFRATLMDETTMFGFVVAKATYRILPNGALERDFENPIAIDKEPQPTPFGDIPGDVIPWKTAVDVWVLGNAYARESGATRSEVRIAVDGAVRRIAVFGDRHWERSRGGLVIAPPRPGTCQRV